MHARNCSHIKFNYTSRHEIEEVIKSLKSSNSYGYDEISVKIIKEHSPFISSPLTKICNQFIFRNILNILIYNQSIRMMINI